jgi:hypothetical protein
MKMQPCLELPNYPQTASEARAEYESNRRLDIESANDHIDYFLMHYLPLFRDYCEEFNVDSVAPEIVFSWAGVEPIPAPTAETYLMAQMKIH